MKPFVDAFTLLAIIPIPFLRRENASAPSRFAPLFFPIVGLLIGLGAAAIFALLNDLLPRNLSAAITLVAIVGITGALHIDGLADSFDGMLGGRDPETRLRIMKQPDIGAFGVAAVVLVLLVDWAALSSISTTTAWVALPMIGLMSRTAPLVVMSIASYVSANGLGQSYVNLSKPALIAVIFLTLVASAVIGGGPALGVAIGGVVAAVLVGLFAKSRIGGANGDVYGASVEMVVMVCLVGVVGTVGGGGLFEPVWTNL